MKKEELPRLFFSTLCLSAFTFGGGYVIVSLMKKRFVDEYHWMEESEMLDLVAIAQSAPGPIAVNAALMTGYRLAGLGGALLCVLATILPPFVTLSIVSGFYTLFRDNLYISLVLEGMQAGVAAVIASAVFDMGRGVVKSRRPLLMGVMLAAFVLNACLDVNAVVIIGACVLAGAARALWARRRRGA